MSSNYDVVNVLNILALKNNGKKFPKLSQTSFSGIVYRHETVNLTGKIGKS